MVFIILYEMSGHQKIPGKPITFTRLIPSIPFRKLLEVKHYFVATTYTAKKFLRVIYYLLKQNIFKPFLQKSIISSVVNIKNYLKFT